MKEQHLHYKKPGNTFLGRTVSGLYVLSPKFDVSPAYFDYIGNTQEEIIKNKGLVNFSICVRFLYGRHVSAKVFLPFRFLLDSFTIMNISTGSFMKGINFANQLFQLYLSLTKNMARVWYP